MDLINLRQMHWCGLYDWPRDMVCVLERHTDDRHYWVTIEYLIRHRPDLFTRERTPPGALLEVSIRDTPGVTR